MSEKINKNKTDLKNRKRYTASFDLKLFEAMKTYSDKTSIPFSKLLDKAMYKFLEDNNLLDYIENNSKE